MVNLLWKATRAGVPTVMDVQTSSVADMMTIFRSDRVLNRSRSTMRRKSEFLRIFVPIRVSKRDHYKH